MSRTLIVASLLTFALAGAAIAAPVEYTIDPGHAQVRFTYNHNGYSNITGRFDTIEGALVYDAENPSASSAHATLDIASVSTGNPKLDAHLATADFFNAPEFSTATFKSTAVSAAGEGKLRMTGDLSIHGVTRAVTFDVSINKVDEPKAGATPKAGFDARTTIKRSDFGVDRYTPNVSDEVRIDITLEAKGKAAG